MHPILELIYIYIAKAGSQQDTTNHHQLAEMQLTHQRTVFYLPNAVQWHQGPFGPR